jgi:DNA-binding PadR family transcriptional regulator
MKGSMAPVMLKRLGEREMDGYEIVQVGHQRTAGRFQWKEGSLYPCLHKLESDGLLKSAWREGPTGKKRKYYRVTRKGRAELARRVEEWTGFAQTVNALLLGPA